MARIALVIGMAVLGAVTGGLGLIPFIPELGAMGAALAAGGMSGAVAGGMAGMMVGSVIGSLAFPTSTNVYGPQLSDRQIMSAANGAPIPQGYGTMRVGAQVIWAKAGVDGSLITQTTNVKSVGGKGGPSQTQTTYTYSCTIALGWCKGPAEVLRIWADSKIIYDRKNPGVYSKYYVNTTNLTPGSFQYSNALKIANLPVFYSGTSTQMPDPTIQAAVGINATPAYRDLCYCVMENLQLTDFGNRIPNFTAEIAFAAGDPHACDTVTVTPITQGNPSNQPVITGPNAAVYLDEARSTAFLIDSNGYYVTRWNYASSPGTVESPVLASIVNTTSGSGWSITTGDLRYSMVVDGTGQLWTCTTDSAQNHWLYALNPHTFTPTKSILVGYLFSGHQGIGGNSGMSAFVSANGTTFIALVGGSAGGDASHIMLVVNADSQGGPLGGIVGYSLVHPAGWSASDGWSGAGHDEQWFGCPIPIWDAAGNVYMVRKRVSDGAWAIWKMDIQSGAGAIAPTNPWGSGPGGNGAIPPANAAYYNSVSWEFPANVIAGTGSGIGGSYNPGDNSITVFTDTGALLKFSLASASITQHAGGTGSPLFAIGSFDAGSFLYSTLKATQCATPDGILRLPSTANIAGHNQILAQYSAETFAPVAGGSVVNITGAQQVGTNTSYFYTLASGDALLVGSEITITSMAAAGNNGTFVITANVPAQAGTNTTSPTGGTFTVVNASGVTATAQTGSGVTSSALDLTQWITPTVDPAGWTAIQDSMIDGNTNSAFVLTLNTLTEYLTAYRLWLDRLAGTGVSIADIITDICAQAGLASDEINTDAVRILGGGLPQNTVGPVKYSTTSGTVGPYWQFAVGEYKLITGYGTLLPYIAFVGFTFPQPVPSNASIIKVVGTISYVTRQNTGSTSTIATASAWYQGAVYGQPAPLGAVFPGPNDIPGFSLLTIAMESSQYGTQLSPTVVNDSSFGFGVQVLADTNATGALFLMGDLITPQGGLVGPGSGVPQITVYYTLGNSTLVEACNGYLIGRPCSAKQALDPLAATYFFDCAESDFVLKFVPRGSPPALSIPQDDIGLVADQRQMGETILQEQELPKEVSVLFSDVNMNYQQNKHSKRRRVKTVHTKNQVFLTIPIAMDANTAKQIADKSLYLMWLERSTYSFNLYKPYYLVMDPTDVITFIYKGQTFEARIQASTVGQGLVLAITGVSENANLYLSQLTGAPSDGFINSLINATGPTYLWFLDVPLLRDSDASPYPGSGYYYAGSSPAVSFPGAVVYAAPDNSNWINVGSLSLLIPYGYTTTALGGTVRSPWVWDNVNSITMKLVYGATPSSTSQLNVLNGANGMLVTSSLAPGYEVVQFTTATQNADGSWTLSGLLRGRRGTEVAIGGHSVGDTVIFLSEGGLRRNDEALAFVGTMFDYRTVTVGQDISSVQSQQYTSQGSDIKPYAPCHLAGNLSAPGGDWTLGWVRRTRLGGAWQDGIGNVTLAEDGQAYVVQVTDNVGNVKRTFQVTSNRATWTAAMQVTDFGSTQSTVRVNVYQVSGQVGSGFKASAVITTSTTLPAVDPAPALPSATGGQWLINGV